MTVGEDAAEAPVDAGIVIGIGIVAMTAMIIGIGPQPPANPNRSACTEQG